MNSSLSHTMNDNYGDEEGGLSATFENGSLLDLLLLVMASFFQAKIQFSHQIFLVVAVSS